MLSDVVPRFNGVRRAETQSGRLGFDSNRDRLLSDDLLDPWYKDAPIVGLAGFFGTLAIGLVLMYLFG
jgi:hypothetical protein